MTDRDHQLLAFTARYRLATAEAIGRTFFAGLSPKACERVLQRLCRTGYLRSYPLSGRLSYYTLTPHAARYLGLPEARAGQAFGPQAAISHYGILEFCTGRQPVRPRLTHEEFRQHFPALGQARGVSVDRYYLDEDASDGTVTLSLLACDCMCHPQRLVRKVRREFARRSAIPAWRPLVQGGLFSVTLLVGSEAKAERLRRDLGAVTHRHRVEVVPELLRVLPEVRRGSPSPRP